MPDDFDDDILVQFAKVNLFKYRSLLSDRDFPAEDNFASSCTGWPKVVQVEECEWIPSHSIFGLAFIFMEDDIASHFFDDCRGMSNFFVLKYRRARNGFVSVVPRNACPPFARCIERCHKIWSVDHSQIIFNSIRQIRHDMQRILCRIVQSQGDFTTRNAKLQVPSFCWFYIKNALARQGIESIPSVRYSQPQCVLSWGLSYHSHLHSGCFDILRFDTEEKLAAFSALFGMTAGYGVCKKRPKYTDGHNLC